MTLKPFRTLDEIGNVRGKRILVREDLNAPLDGGAVTDDTRLRAAVPTLSELSDGGAVVLVLSHIGRPKGQRDPSASTALVCAPLADLVGREVMFIDDCAGPEAAAAVALLAPGSIALLENTRFHPGEEANDPVFAAAMAKLGDLYVNDAFSTAHRAHASTEGLAHLLPAFAGRQMEVELDALEQALGNPHHPVAAVVGGAKVSTKIEVLTHLVNKVDHLIIGGGMANTFLAARGINVGRSLCEHDLTEAVNGIFEAADLSGCTIHLPYDVVTAREFRAHPPTETVNVHEIAADAMILDIGPAAVEALADVLKTCRTLVWNGPLGAFETSPFERATVHLARTAAALTRGGSLISVAGGGDTVAALNQAGCADDFTFVSTAGGAFLEWMEGRTLPGVAALFREPRIALNCRSYKGLKSSEESYLMTFNDMRAKIAEGRGFIAALDQSGGSTPKALKGYGIDGDAYAGDAEMFALIHAMRARIVTSPCFTGDKVIGAILFERTMEGEIGGVTAPQALIDRGVVPFIKIDKGLEAEADGVQLMKPMPELDALLERAKSLGVFGTKERSVINLANRNGVEGIVAQQFDVARRVIAAGLVPIIEPEVDIRSPERGAADALVRDALLTALDALPDGEAVMLKLSIPAVPGLFEPLVAHPKVLRVVALSGGFSRADACAALAKNRGMIASFSRALLEDLRYQMGDEEFDDALGGAIAEIHAASTKKN